MEDDEQQPTKAPSDAFTIVAVTDKDLFNGNLRFVYSTHMNFIKIISYQRWFGAGNQDVLTDMLAKNIAMTPVRNVVSLGCNFPQCLLSGDGTAWGCKDKKFALCPKCINELKKVSAEKTFESFQRGYNNTFNSDYDKPGLAEKYKQIVEKTLAEAKGKAPVDIPLLPPVVTGENLKQGMNYRYCEFEPDTCKTLAEMRKSPLKESGVTDNISLSQKKRDDNFGLEFEGLIKIPDDGVYSFYLSSDDGSSLSIDGKEIILNDGIHGVITVSADIGLKAGFHQLKVSYFEGKLSEFLQLKIRGPKMPCRKFPVELLYHE